jgi:hypothetical protein
MIKKIIMVACLLIAATTLSACGEQVEVPPATVGKILTPKGVKPDLINPSRFRLEGCMLPGSICDKLITVEASDTAIVENMEVMMPKDQLVLTFDLRATISLLPENSSIVFERITGSPTKDGHMHIALVKVYDTYAKQRIRTVARSIMTKYTINQVNENRDTIEKELFAEIQKSLAETPVQAKFVGLADVKFPQIIIDAKIAAEQKRIDIEKEQSQKEVDLVKKIAEMELAKADQAIRLLKAQTIKMENEKVAQSVDSKYLAYRQLEVMETMAKNKNTVFFPVEMLSNTQFTGGLANGMFNNNVPRKE